MTQPDTRPTTPATGTRHVHVIPLGYGDHEASRGETYSLVQCRECFGMIAVAPGGRALAEARRAASPAALDVHLEAALIEEGLLPATPSDSAEWGNAVPDRKAEANYRKQVVRRILARLTAEQEEGE